MLLYFSQTLTVLYFIYNSYVLLHYFKSIKDFTFFIYLSMPVGSITWQARVSIFNSSKPLFKTKIKSRGFLLQFLLHHIVYSLYLIFTFILITQVNNLYQVSSRLIKSIPASFCLRFLKIVDITMSLLFFFKIYCLVVLTLKKVLELNTNL